MVFHCSLSDSNLLYILADLNNATVWTVPIHPVISKLSSPCTNLLVTVRTALITIGIIVTFIVPFFSIPWQRSRYLSLFSHSFNFNQRSNGTAKSTILQVLSILLMIIMSGPFVFQNSRGVCANHSLEQILGCAIPFIRMLKLQYFAQFPVDHLTNPVVPSLIIFLCHFAVFAYYVSDHFTSITT